MNEQTKVLLKDTLILFLISTLFVVVMDHAFGYLKKGNQATDNLVTAVNQTNVEAVKNILSEKGYSEYTKEKYSSLEEYLKARVNKSDENGRTPLMWLAYVNYDNPKTIEEADIKRLEIAEILLKSGASIDAVDNDSWSALMWASWSGLTKITEKLLNSGANLKIEDSKGQSALMLASLRANKTVVKLLLDRGADKGKVSQLGKSAKEYASEALIQYPNKKDLYSEILNYLN